MVCGFAKLKDDHQWIMQVIQMSEQNMVESTGQIINYRLNSMEAFQNVSESIHEIKLKICRGIPPANKLQNEPNNSSIEQVGLLNYNLSKLGLAGAFNPCVGRYDVINELQITNYHESIGNPT